MVHTHTSLLPPEVADRSKSPGPLPSVPSAAGTPQGQQQHFLRTATHESLAAKSHGRKTTLGPAPARDSEQNTHLNLEEDKNRPKNSSRRGTNPPPPPAEQVQHHPRVPAHGGAGSDGPQWVLHQHLVRRKPTAPRAMPRAQAQRLMKPSINQAAHSSVCFCSAQAQLFICWDTGGHAQMLTRQTSSHGASTQQFSTKCSYTIPLISAKDFFFFPGFL